MTNYNLFVFLFFLRATVNRECTPIDTIESHSTGRKKIQVPRGGADWAAVAELLHDQGSSLFREFYNSVNKVRELRRFQLVSQDGAQHSGQHSAARRGLLVVWCRERLC